MFCSGVHQYQSVMTSYVEDKVAVIKLQLNVSSVVVKHDICQEYVTVIEVTDWTVMCGIDGSLHAVLLQGGGGASI